MWVSMLFDSASLTLPFICFGLYSRLPLQIVQILASLPFLFMIFFSTTFSPGSGVAGVKALRYLSNPNPNPNPNPSFSPSPSPSPSPKPSPSPSPNP